MATEPSSTDISVKEDRDALRQQNNNLRVVFKEMSEQLSVFKNRCAGLDTVTLLLREAKSENGRLTKQIKVMETALANLQNRLTNNGLSNSVNIEETEMFVPGASKQTIDNLARENARLKSQLKHSDSAVVKKQTKDLEDLKKNFERLEVDNKSLNHEIRELRNKEAVLMQMQNSKPGHNFVRDEDSSQSKITLISTGMQTSQSIESKDFSKESATEDLKKLLANVSMQCQTWEKELQEMDTNVKDFDENSIKFAELKRNYDEVVLMNHRWQKHCDGKDIEAHALHSKIVELEELLRIEGLKGDTESLKKETSTLRAQTEAQQIENDQLKQNVAHLQRELITCKATVPKVDMSMLEILKQQIQVCTEDFNTERKDREEAVRKAKAYQEEVNRLGNENNLLRTQLDKLSRENSALQQQSQRLTPRDHNPSVMNMPEYRQLTPPADPSTRPHPVLSRLHPSPHPTPPGRGGGILTLERCSEGSMPRQPFDAASNQDGTPNKSNYLQSPNNPTPTPNDFSSLPRQQIQGFEGLPTLSYLETEPGMVSMPAPKNRAAIQFNRKDGRGKFESSSKGSMMACPKCNREFSDNETNEFMAHMDSCTH